MHRIQHVDKGFCAKQDGYEFVIEFVIEFGSKRGVQAGAAASNKNILIRPSLTLNCYFV
jgi:hypothetical protein